MTSTKKYVGMDVHKESISIDSRCPHAVDL